MNHQGLSLELSHPQWMWILGFPIVALSSPFIATGMILMTIMHPIKNMRGAFIALPTTALYVVGIFSLWIGSTEKNLGNLKAYY